eukprot:CFRG4672T1
MKIIGLTGGIASGKSTVSSYLTSLNIPVVDADKVAREAVQPGQPALKQIREAFGDDFICEDGNLDRAKMGSLVFTDVAARTKLNSITHPAIQKLMLKRILTHFCKGHRMIVLDTPLLFESKTLLKICSKIVCVYCDPDQELERLMKRDGLEIKDAKNRIEAQMPLEDKARQSDYVIDNSGSIETTHEQVNELAAQLEPTFMEAHGLIILGFTCVAILTSICIRAFVI